MRVLNKGWKGTVGQFLTECQQELHLPKSDILDFISFIKSIDISEILFHFGDELYVDQTISDLLNKLKSGYPIAYLTKRREFYGHEFYVDESVLIPRHETEILVETVLNTNKKEKASVLDICTGSGCILIAIMKMLTDSIGVGVDISSDALNIAHKNSALLGVDHRVEYLCADALDIESVVHDTYDIVTCNPPYISRAEQYGKSIMFEPEQALFADDDGLVFYKKILFILDKLCNKGGFACFEIGASQRVPLEKFGVEIGKELIFVQDYAGHDRVMIWKN